jgi:ribonuclease HI
MTTFLGGSYVIYADGSTVPGSSGVGVVALNAAGRVVHVINQPLPEMTNNEAEYTALKLALETAAQLQADVVEIRLDSEIVVGQMTGAFAVKSHKLRELHWQACELARQFPRVRYTHVPRELNALADALASEASAGRTWSL